ncbi:PilZ domain-containing protein [Pleionea sp. CnH1-48]|uniref:PilZ domain-containing protein n=1 Tax=Pleionea sp. CnH1-48 TaxID=2954494 RepID=UPI002097E203
MECKDYLRETTMAQEQERRDFYRIDDEISLQIFPVDAAAGQPKRQSFDDQMPPEFQMLRELRQLDSENAQTLSSIFEKNRSVGHYLKMQNEKIELIARYIVKHHGQSLKTTKVNISGGGIRFRHPEALAEKSHLGLKIVLFPECFSFSSLAEVVSCQSDNGSFLIATEFRDIDHHDQDELIKHITRLQSRQLRAQRLGEKPERIPL